MMARYFRETIDTQLPVSERKAARKAAAQMFFTQVALTGALGLPMASGILRIIEAVFPESELEKDLRLGVKFYENSSSFKKALNALEVGDTIIASQVAGEFTMPKDTNKKMVWIAGGIGITPFRSMSKCLFDIGEKRDVVLLFSCKTANDIVYENIFEEAGIKTGLKTICVVGDMSGQQSDPNIRVGMINTDMIKNEVPDYKKRIFYISGPRTMVNSFEDALAKLGISRKNIKVDFFPGYV